MMAITANALNMLAEKVIQPAINPKHLAYCPTMDLIALVTLDEQVHIYRLNGQRVFGVSGKHSAGSVSSIQWKPNGTSHTLRRAGGLNDADGVQGRLSLWLSVTSHYS